MVHGCKLLLLSMERHFFPLLSLCATVTMKTTTTIRMYAPHTLSSQTNILYEVQKNSGGQRFLRGYWLVQTLHGEALNVTTSGLVITSSDDWAFTPLSDIAVTGSSTNWHSIMPKFGSVGSSEFSPIEISNWRYGTLLLMPSVDIDASKMELLLWHEVCYKIIDTQIPPRNDVYKYFPTSKPQ